MTETIKELSERATPGVWREATEAEADDNYDALFDPQPNHSKAVITVDGVMPVAHIFDFDHDDGVHQATIDLVCAAVNGVRSGHLTDSPAPDLELRQCLHNMTVFAKRVMESLEKHGGAIVPHLLDTDDNAGQFLRIEIGIAEKLLSSATLSRKGEG